MDSRERILKKIQSALQTKTDKPIAKPDFNAEIYVQSPETDGSVIFAENFQKSKAEFYFCENLEALLANLSAFLQKREFPLTYVWENYLQELLKFAQVEFVAHDHDLAQIEVGITLCEFLVARTGSILVSSRQTAGRRLGIYPPVHIVVGFTSQIVNDVQAGMKALQEKYADNFPSMISVVSGPSQTADIEKTLVLGAHGPKELILFLVDDLTDNSDASGE
ncbi:MAG: LUD domain-containing protein [Microscillaceae bacterium]|nr:LUD domain-containing protein [Microscillaceae bacterium]